MKNTLHRKTVKLVRFTYLLFLCWSLLPAWGHLCDDVWRQRDKLIVKPEFQNLVIKDETQFKVFLQNNMDRAIAEISLEAKSDAFDTEISPQRMEVPTDKRVYFEVKIKAKEELRSGKYPISFRLVARGQTFMSFGMETEIEGKKAVSRAREPSDIKPVPSSIPSEELCGISLLHEVASPQIDGDLGDPCWKKAAMFTDFRATDGKRVESQTIGFLTADERNIYIALSCQEKEPDKVREDFVEIYLFPSLEEEASFTLRFGRDGSISTYRTTPTSVKRIDAGVVAKVKLVDKNKSWFVEGAIPIASLGIGAFRREDTWLANFTRERVGAARETSFRFGSAENFRQKDGCGRICFLP